MTCYGPLTPACTPAVAEHLVARLLRKGLPAAVIIVAEELPYLQVQDDTPAKDGQVLDRPHIPAVYPVADPSAIGASAVFKG